MVEETVAEMEESVGKNEVADLFFVNVGICGSILNEIENRLILVLEVGFEEEQ